MRSVACGVLFKPWVERCLQDHVNKGVAEFYPLCCLRRQLFPCRGREETSSPCSMQVEFFMVVSRSGAVWQGTLNTRKLGSHVVVHQSSSTTATSCKSRDNTKVIPWKHVTVRKVEWRKLLARTSPSDFGPS